MSLREVWPSIRDTYVVAEIVPTPSRFGDRLFSRAEIVTAVRRYAPSSLLPLIAQENAKYPFAQSWAESPEGALTGWALAEIARISIARGRPNGEIANLEALIDLACMELNSDEGDQDSRSTPDGQLRLLLRLTLHQYRYEGFAEVEWARTLAILSETPWPSTKPPAQLIKPGWEITTLGTDLSTYVKTIKYVYALSLGNRNQFWRGLFDGNPNAWSKTIDPFAALAVIDRHLAISLLDFKKQELARTKKTDLSLARYAVNPLWSRPMVEDSPGHYVVPVGRLLIARSSPLGLFHSVDTSVRNAFASDLGILFEAYVGAQLQQAIGTITEPERKYGPKQHRKDSIDWFWIFPDAIVLVEVKSRRPTQHMITNIDTAVDELAGKLNEGLEQLERTHLCIQNADEWTAFLPANRPIYGLLVTLEPFPEMNVPVARAALHNPGFPVSIVSSATLEFLVTLSANTIQNNFAKAASTGLNNSFDLLEDLYGTPLANNKMLTNIVDATSRKRG